MHNAQQNQFLNSSLSQNCDNGLYLYTESEDCALLILCVLIINFINFVMVCVVYCFILVCEFNNIFLVEDTILPHPPRLHVCQC